MLELIGKYIIGFIDTTGYWGVFVLMTLESACIPIPSEITMPFAGSLIKSGRFDFWLLSFVGGFSNLIGSILAYWLGSWGQDRVVRKLIQKYGKYFLISEHELDRSEKWFLKYGEIIVFTSRLLPAVRTFISLPAGIAKMNLFRFCGYSFIGSFFWSAFLTYIGLVLGKNWVSIEGYFRKFDILIVILFIILAFIYISHKVRQIKRKKN